VRATGADYLALCPASSEIGIYAAERADSLAAQLRLGRTPGWLEPVAGFGGALRVYRIG